MFIILVIFGLGWCLFIIVIGVFKMLVNLCVCVMLLWFGEIMIYFFGLIFGLFLKCLVRIGIFIKWLIGILKNFWICGVCKFNVIIWVVLVVLIKFVINLVVIGLWLWVFLFCFVYL